jgi:hypothetical protein
LPFEVYPPNPIGDLTGPPSALVTDTTLTLTWSAPSDPDGAVYAYALRYRADATIAESNWNTATVLRGLPTPQPPGAPESFTFTIRLCPGVYSFALKAVDATGNWSSLSNVVDVVVPGTGWTNAVVDLNGGYYVSHAYDAAGNPAIGYIDFYGSPNAVAKVARFNGSSWTIEPLGDGNRGASFAFSPSGTPSLSWQTYVSWASYYSLNFAERQGASWNVTVVESKSVGNSETTSLAYDSAGNPAIAYRHASKGLQFAKRVNGVWQKQTVDRSAGCRYFSLAYNPVTGNPAIAYSDDVNPADGYLDTLKLAEWNGSAWAIQTVETGVVGYGVFASLDFDTAGNLFIAHLELQGNSRFIQFLRRLNGVWQPAETFPGDYSTLTLGTDGSAFVSYDLNNQKRVATRTSAGVWTLDDVVDPCQGTGWMMSVKADPLTTKPTLAHATGYNLTFSYK